MLIEPYIEKSYPTTKLLNGIKDIESELMNQRFFIVMEEPDRYMGMLTIPDVLARKKKLVADCLTPKPHVAPHASMEEALQVMTSSHLPALPVVDDKNHFHGILSQHKLIETLKAIDQEKTELLKKEVSVSDRYKEEFIKNISHEIRTPLNAIQGLSEILIYSDISKEDKEDFASLLHAKTDELLSVVDSLIDLSQIQTGDIDFTPTDQINPERFCREIEEKARKIRSSYKKNHIELICSPRLPENFEFQTSLTYLQQVMLHLINNAIKFTEEGKIEFGCYQKEQGQIGFFVKDTGLGIDPEKQNIIFKAFEKAWSKEYHIYPGMGLGLTIASKVIEAAGGHIWFESKQNEGTAFYFWLPEKNMNQAPKA